MGRCIEKWTTKNSKKYFVGAECQGVSKINSKIIIENSNEIKIEEVEQNWFDLKDEEIDFNPEEYFFKKFDDFSQKIIKKSFCRINCAYNGICRDGICYCFYGYTGDSCEYLENSFRYQTYFTTKKTELDPKKYDKINDDDIWKIKNRLI